MANKDTAKQWFEEGDLPTDVQIAQTFDWLQWKDEPIPMEAVQGLITYLSSVIPPIEISINASGSYTIPAGYAIYKLYVKTILADSTLVIGTEEFGDDILAVVDLIAAITLGVDVTLVADADTTIWFTVPQTTIDPVDTTIKIYLHKI